MRREIGQLPAPRSVVPLALRGEDHCSQRSDLCHQGSTLGFCDRRQDSDKSKASEALFAYSREGRASEDTPIALASGEPRRDGEPTTPPADQVMIASESDC